MTSAGGIRTARIEEVMDESLPPPPHAGYEDWADRVPREPIRASLLAVEEQ